MSKPRPSSSSRSLGPALLSHSPSTKPTNPKDLTGVSRPHLCLISTPALVEESLALLEGALKYGTNNWVAEQARATVYVSACARHVFKWLMGQSHDPVTGVHHLGSARASLNILIDAEHRKVLIDDRPPALPRLDDLFANAEKVAKKLFEMYGSVKPRHYHNGDV